MKTGTFAQWGSGDVLSFSLRSERLKTAVGLFSVCILNIHTFIWVVTFGYTVWKFIYLKEHCHFYIL